ncbi:Hypothetical protein HVR_LOCUS408, partial [uncultured virus]
VIQLLIDENKRSCIIADIFDIKLINKVQGIKWDSCGYELIIVAAINQKISENGRSNTG